VGYSNHSFERVVAAVNREAKGPRSTDGLNDRDFFLIEGDGSITERNIDTVHANRESLCAAWLLLLT